MISITSLLLAAASLAQIPTPVIATATPEEKLEYMRAVTGSYRFSLTGDRSGLLKLGTEPSFRMGKQPIGDILDGAIFFWSSAEGRPEAAVQVFQIKDQSSSGGHWIEEFISLSPGPFLGRQAGLPSWSPKSPGVKFQPVPGAPKPADTPAQRARQMRSLVQEFRVSDLFGKQSWSELRLLTTPVAKYGRANSTVIEGALFAFAMGTDPEAFLFLEARPGAEGLQWHYAFAPMTCYELKGNHNGKVTWTTPFKEGATDPAKNYYVRLD